MNELGNVSISQEVVATIAELVVSEIEGVSSLVGGKSKNEIIKFFQSVSSGGKGIEVEVGETECTIDLYIVAKMGYQLPALAGEIQSKVVKAITETTGLKVQEVNVYIQKIVEDDKKEEVAVIEKVDE
ncbi:Asp23/Gls24 family envelope stress response protein [Leptotrichia sp. oral taxon 847]|uniref:Asp23/Gls24 family envelope stress response protein n=1 Tax=Leptotrichia sp. oral taxon 847 TaxID=1785996 RepID=UPI000767F869|nr:Asp23/Gls24 family envelope stress response protein [Leptotrichia sp. oral taxon 847]AMD95518.1 alkaline-shock protein [Leptotrichia sp. oral taxon 847]